MMLSEAGCWDSEAGIEDGRAVCSLIVGGSEPWWGVRYGGVWSTETIMCISLIIAYLMHMLCLRIT